MDDVATPVAFKDKRMVQATANDKKAVVEMLAQSFRDNKSVQYLIPPNKSRWRRIKRLMAYSFDICSRFGYVWLSDDKKACALVVYPDRKRTSLQSIWWNVKLVLTCIGLARIGKAMKREAAVGRQHPSAPFCYLWFIGVQPNDQNKGVGSRLLQELIAWARSEERMIYLETSTQKNLPWYQKHGFEVYHQLDLGFTLYCLKRG